MFILSSYIETAILSLLRAEPEAILVELEDDLSFSILTKGIERAAKATGKTVARWEKSKAVLSNGTTIRRVDPDEDLPSGTIIVDAYGQIMEVTEAGRQYTFALYDMN